MASTGADSVDGGAGSDTLVLTGTSADLNAASDAQIVNIDAISAAGANAGVTIDLQHQSDGFTVTGSAFGDTITGSSGADTIHTGDGNDLIVGFSGADSVDGGDGTNAVALTKTSDDLNAASDAQIANIDAISAAGANAGVTIDLQHQSDGFTIIGSAFADTITGSSGADTIIGGSGGDTLAGGAGSDVFKYAAVSDSSGAGNVRYGSRFHVRRRSDRSVCHFWTYKLQSFRIDLGIRRDPSEHDRLVSRRGKQSDDRLRQQHRLRGEWRERRPAGASSGRGVVRRVQRYCSIKRQFLIHRFYFTNRQLFIHRQFSNRNCYCW